MCHNSGSQISSHAFQVQSAWFMALLCYTITKCPHPTRTLNMGPMPQRTKLGHASDSEFRKQAKQCNISRVSQYTQGADHQDLTHQICDMMTSPPNSTTVYHQASGTPLHLWTALEKIGLDESSAPRRTPPAERPRDPNRPTLGGDSERQTGPRMAMAKRKWEEARHESMKP